MYVLCFMIKESSEMKIKLITLFILVSVHMKAQEIYDFSPKSEGGPEELPVQGEDQLE